MRLLRIIIVIYIHLRFRYKMSFFTDAFFFDHELIDCWQMVSDRLLQVVQELLGTLILVVPVFLRKRVDPLSADGLRSPVFARPTGCLVGTP